MKPSLPKVICSSQLCTVGDKNILFGMNNIFSTIFHVKANRKKACLLSLDFFKAYDRVVISYLIKVMSKMNFSLKFCEWIHMLHVGAQTRFLLTNLSRPIDVNFLIRQGDPLAMILYIIYIEPLLLYLERNLEGIKIGRPALTFQLISPVQGQASVGSSLTQKSKSYCDDVNILTEHLPDLVKVDQAVQEFEAFSGAILSRRKKCKIIGFDQWKSRNEWPIHYVQTVKEVKVFGVFVMGFYRSLLKRNWDYRLSKFKACIQTWSSRSLSSLSSRIEVLKIFALSRVYYLASILPISRTVVTHLSKSTIIPK